MFKTILVPLDGSALAARALPFAKRLARAGGARLIVVRAYLPADDALLLRVEYPEFSAAERADEDRETATAEFQSAVDGLRADGLDVEDHFVEGAAADVIFDVARSTRANLIVMSTHGRGGLGRVLYGSVADKVLLRVPVPVLLVPAGCTRVWTDVHPEPVLVPLDGSSLAAEALRPARDLAATRGGELLLLTVVEALPVYPYETPETVDALDAAHAAHAAQYLDDVAAELRRAAGPGVSTRIVHGDPAEHICAVARAARVGAIAMASHGRTGVSRLLFGSVTNQTLQHSTVPVLVYRPITVHRTASERAIEKIATATF
ncbi:MAG TPA: universal stress protein [Chloroflexota bacterium]|nr:universal stress protein [Chloroflexota bacterium]